MTARFCLLLATLALGCKGSGLVGENPSRDLAMRTDAGPAPADDLAVSLGPDLLPVGPDMAWPRPCGASDQCQGVEICHSDVGCCSCGAFAGYCLPYWTCARPGANDPRCPATEPTSSSSCDVDGLECWYCADDGPHQAGCYANLNNTCPDDSANCWWIGTRTDRCD